MRRGRRIPDFPHQWQRGPVLTLLPLVLPVLPVELPVQLAVQAVPGVRQVLPVELLVQLVVPVERQLPEPGRRQFLSNTSLARVEPDQREAPADREQPVTWLEAVPP